MALTAEDVTELTAELAQLKQARTSLLTGNMNVSVGSDGDSASFVPPSLDAIEARIITVRAQLGLGRGRVAIRPRFA